MSHAVRCNSTPSFVSDCPDWTYWMSFVIVSS
nr:MAG TPA: hypothetical protein [Caudoviricetes sp.]